MEILALVIWLLLGGLGTVIAPWGIVNPGAGLAALGAFTGVAVAVLYIVLDAPLWAAWAQLGLAVLGIVGSTLAVAWLSNDELITGSEYEGLAGGVIGLALPIYFALLFVTVLMAFEITDPVV